LYQYVLLLGTLSWFVGIATHAALTYNLSGVKRDLIVPAGVIDQVKID
jgi:hypothetical protein